MTENNTKPGVKSAGRHSAKPTAASPAARAAAPAKAGTASGTKTAAKASAKTGTKTGTKATAKASAKTGTKSRSKAISGGGKRGKKKRNILHSTFYRVYFAVVLVCVIGIVAGAIWLRGLLADYESAQPAHVADAAAQMFVDGDYDSVYAYDTSAADLAGGRDFYVASMGELARGKDVSWAETYSASDDEKVYNVLLSGEKFAEMTLVPSGEVSKHGYTRWKLGSVTTFVTMAEAEPEPELPPVEEEAPAAEEQQPTGIPCHITVPSQYVVTVDGVTLSPADALNASIPAVSEGLLPEGVPNPTLAEYQVYSADGAPQISVTDASGNPQQLTSSGDYSWSCPLPEDAQLKAQFEGPIVEIAKSIASCAAKTVKKDAVLRYCAENSPARESINSFDNSTGYSKKPESFENIVTSNYCRYSENCFSCHVSFDYLSKFTAEVTKTYPTTMTLYFIYQGDSGKLYSFTLY